MSATSELVVRLGSTRIQGLVDTFAEREQGAIIALVWSKHRQPDGRVVSGKTVMPLFRLALGLAIDRSRASPSCWSHVPELQGASAVTTAATACRSRYSSFRYRDRNSGDPAHLLHRPGGRSALDRRRQRLWENDVDPRH